MAGFELPPPQKPNLEKVNQSLRNHGIDPDKIDSIPTVDPTQSPYRKTLEEFADRLPLCSVMWPTRQWYTLSERHRVSKDVALNDGEANDTYAMNWSDTTSETNSISVSASVDVTIKEIVKVGMSTTYGHTWTTGHAEGTAFTITIPPQHFGWIERATLISNIEGDFIFTGSMVLATPDGTVIMRNGPFMDPFRYHGTFSGPADVAGATGLLIGVTRKAKPEELAKYRDQLQPKRTGSFLVAPSNIFYEPAFTDGGRANETVLAPK